jgi:hypothetical protein
MAAYAEKVRMWKAAGAAGEVPVDRLAWTPFAVSTWGAVAPGSARAMLIALGGGPAAQAALGRVVFAGLLRQATSVTERLRAAIR